jgi:radical SAM protein with 4Fe4S-binding SPASM domain
MATQVPLGDYKILKKKLKAALQRWFPAISNRARVTISKYKDRRYREQQEGIFEHLAAATDKPNHIEIETLNRCNGACSFCPVNRFDDPRPLQHMEEALFHRIIDELADWDFDGQLKLFSNNEPFLDKRIFDFTEYARTKLPHTSIKILTNGTVLDAEKVERILPLVSQLHVNNYSMDFDLPDNIRAAIDHVNANLPHLASKMTISLRQVDQLKTTRGGGAPNRDNGSAIYTSRCAYPFFQMVIRPDGKISLCCNDALGEVTLGDVSSQPLREAWNSEKRREIQNAMLKGRDQIDICSKCDNLNWAHPKRLDAALKAGFFSLSNK